MKRKSNLMSGLFDTKKIKFTKEYTKALHLLLKAELKLMQKIHGTKYWRCGIIKINDLSNSRHIEFQYGGLSDAESIEKYGDIFIKI